jgi:hypothetical protein
VARSPFLLAALSVGLVSLATAAPALAQSPSAGAAVPSLSAAPAVSAAPATAAGPITWTVNTKGKDFDANPTVYAVGQLPDGRLVVVGAIGDQMTRPTGAAWVSPDGTKWGRLKLKAPKGSSITAVASLGTQTILAGFGDEGGLTWISADGTTWSKATPMEGTIYSLIPTAAGYMGVGILDGAATAWMSPDGSTWTSATLAPAGRALHVLDLGGTIVAAGATVDADGASTPTTWASTDGITWTAIPLAEAGTWSTPTAAATPVGAVVVISEPGQGGTISHVWTSADGVDWTEAVVPDTGLLGASGSIGTAALLIGGDATLRSPDGATWAASPEPAFEGWTPRDMTTIADGRLFAAGDAYLGQTGSAMATFIGEAQPLP